MSNSRPQMACNGTADCRYGEHLWQGSPGGRHQRFVQPLVSRLVVRVFVASGVLKMW
jgi:hypothetical protein